MDIDTLEDLAKELKSEETEKVSNKNKYKKED